jgi:hypothetical protein
VAKPRETGSGREKPLAAQGGREILSAMRLRCLIAVFFLLGGVAGAAVRYDMTKDELLKELGKPTSVLVKGGREVLTYPNNVRIELEHGKVVSVKGLDIVAAEAAEAAAVVAAEQKKAEEAAAKVEAEQQKKLDEEEARAEKAAAAADAKARAEMEKAIGDMENMHGGAPTLPAQESFAVGEFLLGLVVKWLLMVAALKLTTKYWNADVEWKGLMLAAAADTGVRAVVLFIGERLLKMFSVFYADEALAAIVLVLVLRKVSTNQSLQQAVTITMTCKVFSVVVGSFLVTVLLHALH